MSAKKYFEFMHRVVDEPGLVEDPGLLIQLSQPGFDFVFPVCDENHTPYLGKVSRKGRESDFQYWWERY